MANGGEVIASLVVGSNGATSLAGRSKGLRTPEDRERFLALRRSADLGAIVVGSATAAVEPYQQTPHPLFIYKRASGVSPAEFLRELRGKISGAILCEGGVTFIHQLLEDDALDLLHLTRAPIAGDGHFLNFSLITKRMSLISREVEGETTFEKYERASRFEQ
jgi:riboflavin biosynthesis pyrimidine reductase